MKLKAQIEAMRDEAKRMATAARLDGDTERYQYYKGVWYALSWTTGPKDANTNLLEYKKSPR